MERDRLSYLTFTGSPRGHSNGLFESHLTSGVEGDSVIRGSSRTDPNF